VQPPPNSPVCRGRAIPIVVLIIMDVFLQKMRIKKGRKALIIEEAWKAIASPTMAEYIKYLYKTVRKFHGIAGVVTQELNDVIDSPIVKEAIINNSDIKIQKKSLDIPVRCQGSSFVRRVKPYSPLSIVSSTELAASFIAFLGVNWIFGGFESLRHGHVRLLVHHRRRHDEAQRAQLGEVNARAHLQRVAHGIAQVLSRRSDTSPTPSERLPLSPTPSANTEGSIPTTMHSTVIAIGRKRTAAGRVAKMTVVFSE